MRKASLLGRGDLFVAAAALPNVKGLRKANHIRPIQPVGRNKRSALLIAPYTRYFQNESPGADKESNWLPAPKGEFIPMMRMYYPAVTSPSVIDGSWKIPPVVEVS
jgi:hypothetical protein